MPEDDPRRRYTANLQGEVDSAALYRTLAQTEKNPQLAQVYQRLAAIEEAHAEYWRDHISAIDHRVPMLRPGLRTRALAWLARRFGPAFVLPTIDTLEHLDSGTYDAQPEAVAGGLPAAERSHARIIEALAAGAPGALSGATLAGSCSMALGEWLSVNTARESSQRQIATEAEELEQVPEEEQEELSLIYQAKGLPEDLAKSLAEQLITNKKTALDTLVREELGIDPEELGGSAWAAGGTSFLLFAVGAIFPVAPYFTLAGMPAMIASLAASGLALFLIGAGTTLFTGRGVLVSGVRQLLVGFAAAGVTYGVGKLIGVAVTG